MPDSIIYASTVLPPLSFVQYSVAAHLSIYRAEGGYKVLLFSSDEPIEALIPISEHDLQELSFEMQAALRLACRPNSNLEPDDAEAVRNIAKAGHRAYRKIFERSGLGPVVQNLLRRNPGLPIVISSNDFFIPWELIYPRQLTLPVAINQFWGAQRAIARQLIRRVGPNPIISPNISFSGLPTIGLFANVELEAVAKREIPFFERLHNNRQIYLKKLRELDREKWEVEINEFRSFWEQSLDVAHFACHAEFKRNSPSASHVILTQDFSITIANLEEYEFSIKSNPLVVLNACSTGSANTLYTSAFARALLDYGARGVVATECNVPDDFAADFSEQFYTLLLSGLTVAEALLTARKFFINRYRNPTVFAYSLYGRLNIKLAQDEGDAS